MANKHQVLKLLEKGLSNKEIAARLNCLDAYVRAVKAREFGRGREVDNRYQRNRYATDSEFREYRKVWASAYRKKKIRTDPKWRAANSAYQKAWRAARKETSA